MRTFTLWADRRRGARLAEVVTRSAERGGPAVYEVLGAAGEPPARITRDPASFPVPRRTRWTVETVRGQSATGRKGTLFRWVVWWLISPVQAVPVAAAPHPVADVDGVVLDYASGGTVFELTEVAGEWDFRVTAALLALLGTHEGRLGTTGDRAH